MEKKQKNENINISDVCASFQTQAVQQLEVKCREELLKSGYKKLVLAGGVSANAHLRERMKLMCEEIGVELFCPSLTLCTDNAAMIASQAYFNFMNNAKPAGLDLAPQSTIKL